MKRAIIKQKEAECCIKKIMKDKALENYTPQNSIVDMEIAEKCLKMQKILLGISSDIIKEIIRNGTLIQYKKGQIVTKLESELDKNSNIWYCERAINEDGLDSYQKQNIAIWNIQHAYISFGEDPWNGASSGCGFSSGCKGTLPSDEKAFNPTRCIPCHNLKSFLRKLEFGESKGKKCCEATDEEIENCIRSYPARKDYRYPLGIRDIRGILETYVCWTWANEAIEACCLTCGSKYKTSAN